jgi:hypothetical protein
VTTFSRCRRLRNVYRKTQYPSSLFPVANVRVPCQQCHEEGKLVYTGTYREKMATNFLACSSSFIYPTILSEGCPLCYFQDAG